MIYDGCKSMTTPDPEAAHGGCRSVQPQKIRLTKSMTSALSNNVWTSRHRLLTALAGGMPDRVPINTYELAGRNSRDWYNLQPSYRGLMDYIRAHTDCMTNWNPRPATDRYTCEERFLCSDYPVEIETQHRNRRAVPAHDAHLPYAQGRLALGDTDGRGRLHHLAGRTLVQEHSRRG